MSRPLNPDDVAFIVMNQDGTASVGVHIKGGFIKPEHLPAKEAICYRTKNRF